MMDINQAIELANTLLVQHSLRPLSDVETLILRGAWDHLTYEAIAQISDYSDSYLRKDVGPRLWQDLTTVLGESVSKTNFRAALERKWEQQRHPFNPVSLTICKDYFPHRKTDWGEAIDVSFFLGRSQEQETLRHWIISERCRFILLLGMGGIGKTALSIKVGQTVESDFEFLIWRSLRNAPPVLDLLIDLIKFLAQQQGIEVPHTFEAAQFQLIQQLRNHRCLLILDNAEAILQSGNSHCHYRPGYENYGQLFQQVGETWHLSCLIVTSRERPQDLAPKFGQQLPMRCLPLSGLTYHDGQALLNSIGHFTGTFAEWQSILDRYAGNPLALKIMASFVIEVFAGDLTQLLVFLGQSSYIFDDIRELLDQQFQRLSPQEQEVMTWLTIKREPTALMELPGDLVHPLPPHELLQVLAALQSRSLIEKVESRFTQQPVVMEYVSSRLITSISEQIGNWQVGAMISTQHLLRHYALIQVQAKDYIRETQIRLILQPVLDALLTRFGTVAILAQHLRHMIQAMKASPTPIKGYGAGNIINMLRQLDVDLAGDDFSQLTIWQADLQGLTLYNANFAESDLSKSRFSQIFGWITAIAFSPDGTYWVAGDSAGSLHLWFSTPEQRQITLHAHPNFIFALAISSDSRLLVSSSIDGTIKLWDAKTSQCLYTLNAHTKIVWCVTFTKDVQQFASSCEDGTIKIWDCQTGQCLQTLSANSSSVRSVVFTPDQRYLVSGSEDCLIRLWDLGRGECVRVYAGHTQTVWTVDISPDGQWIGSGGNDYLVKLWDLQSGVCLHDFEGHTLQIWSLAFAPDGQTIASASMDQTVRVWNLQDRECTACFRGHSSMVMSVAFSPDTKTVASGGMGRVIKHWDIASKACVRSWSGYKNIIWSVAFAPGSGVSTSEPIETIVSSSIDGIVRLWHVAEGECIKTMKHPTEVHAIAFSPDGKQLVSGNLHTRSTLKIWDIETETCLMTIPAHWGKVNSVCWSHNGVLLASGGDDKHVQLYHLKNRQVDRMLRGHEAVIWSVAFSHDDRFLASGSFDQRVRIWDVHSGECLHILSGHANALTTIVFHPDHPYIATASSDATVKLWSLETGDCDRTLVEHQNVVMGIAFSLDGHTFASGSYDQTIRIWDVKTWDCKAIFQANSLVHSVAFSPNGRTLVSGGDNGTLQLWDLQTLQCIKTLHLPALYAGMNIRNVIGLSEAQEAMLLRLGALRV